MHCLREAVTLSAMFVALLLGQNQDYQNLLQARYYAICCHKLWSLKEFREGRGSSLDPCNLMDLAKAVLPLQSIICKQSAKQKASAENRISMKKFFAELNNIKLFARLQARSHCCSKSCS